MNCIKNIFCTSLTLLTCLAGTMQTANCGLDDFVCALDDCKKTDQKFVAGGLSDDITLEFKRLAEIALNSEGRSDTMRAGRDLIRLGVKAACACAYVYGSDTIRGKIGPSKLNIIPAAALLLWDRANFRYDECDKSLTSLQNLEKYIMGLSGEQKQEIAKLFKEKYSTSLHRKISNEKGDRIARIIQLLVTGLDLVAPCLLFGNSISRFTKGELTADNACIALTTGICATDMLQVLTDTWYNMNYKKDLVLKKIEEAFN